MTADPPGAAGTAGDGYRLDPAPVPRPREASDPAEPGHRIPAAHERKTFR